MFLYEPLADHIADVRLIPTVEHGVCSQIERFYRGHRLELVRINRVLDVHLEDGITYALGLDLHGTPCVWNLLVEKTL